MSTEAAGRKDGRQYILVIRVVLYKFRSILISLFSLYYCSRLLKTEEKDIIQKDAILAIIIAMNKRFVRGPSCMCAFKGFLVIL